MGGGRRHLRQKERENGKAGDETPWKSKKGFGYRARQSRARPSNIPAQDLLLDSRYAGTVLELLKNTKVGRVKDPKVQGMCNIWCNVHRHLDTI